MIQIPYHPNFSTNRDRCKDDELPCVVCGKGVKTPKNWVRIVNGGTWIGTAAEGDAEPAADLGYYPVGSDCLRKHPEIKEYARNSPE